MQEGGPKEAQKVLQSFQGLVQAQLAKLQTDFQAGKSFPALPAIQDLKAFQVPHTRPACAGVMADDCMTPRMARF